MQVTAYDINNGLTAVELGSVQDALWVDKLKRTQKRKIQPSYPINGSYPNFYDRLQTDDTLAFAASQSFPTVGAALINWLTWPATVPRLAHLNFTQDGEILWIPNCAIIDVTQLEKKGALVIWAYQFQAGGAPSSQKPT